MDEVGFEDYVMGEGVSLIEWANLIEEILPQKSDGDHDREESGRRV